MTEDKERQNDEVLVLESIYPKELIVKSKWPFAGCLKISPSVMKENFPVKIISKLGDKCEERVLKVEHLPPIELYFQCPEDYPSKSQPYFMLSCVWLPDSQLTQICGKLDSLWDNYESEILFIWASFLKEDCCAFLQLQELQITLDMDCIGNKNDGNDMLSSSTPSNQNLIKSIIRDEYAAKTLNVIPLSERSNDRKALKKNTNSRLRYLKRSKIRRKADDDIFKYETPKDILEKEKIAAKKLNSSVCDKPIETESSKEDSNTYMSSNQIFKIMTMFGQRRKKTSDYEDTRIIPKKSEEVKSVVKIIEDYNDLVLETEFKTEQHDCEVCFEQKQGSACIRLKPCKHVFCKTCVRDYLTLNIVNGNMGAIRCLQYDCNSPFNDLQIHQNIEEDVYRKYRKFSVKFAVESDPNLLYCPREICQSVARISSLSQDMCHCENCGFYFCMYCKKAYHGVQMCDLKNEERIKVIREYQEASQERKLELERRFTKAQLIKWVEDDLSQKWLQECSKPCPNCRAVIQKVDGCNKMMCLNCNTPFCWLCSMCLNRSQPYKHFIDPQSPCYQKLFPPEEMGEGEEFEDEEDDDDFYALVDEMLLNVNDAALEDMWPYYFVD